MATEREPVVVEWRCEKCGHCGVAVALKGDYVDDRVEKSHHAENRHCRSHSFVTERRERGVTA